MSTYTKTTIIEPISPQINTPTVMVIEKTADRLLSLDYKIEDIEGQCVKDWFKNDFGAKNTFEFHAKVKGTGGRGKAKVVVEPTSNNTISITEDLEIQAKLHQDVQCLLKVRPKELSAQFDFGFRPVAGNWFNPFVVFRLPRTNGLARSAGNFGLGGVFHFDSFFNRRSRYQIELDFGFGSESIDQKVLLRQNFSLWYKKFILGIYESWDFTNGFSHETKLSTAYKEGPARAYAQLDLGGDFRLSNLEFGGSYHLRPDVNLFVQTNQKLADKSKGDQVFSGIHVGTGVEFKHFNSGLGVKLGYFHDNKIASVLSFGLNKHFSGSLLFDVEKG